MRVAYEDWLRHQRGLSDETVKNNLRAKLGFDDRLVMLLERERQQRNDRSYLARLRKAQLRERADIADIDCSAGRGITRTTLLNLATGGWIHAGANLTVVGATGVGKTILACALANQACRQNRSVAYLRVPDLVLSLDAGRGGTNYIRLMRRLTTVDLLILDDWGLQNFSPQGRRDILELIEPRSARRSTIGHKHPIVMEAVPELMRLACARAERAADTEGAS